MIALAVGIAGSFLAASPRDTGLLIETFLKSSCIYDTRWSLSFQSLLRIVCGGKSDSLVLAPLLPLPEAAAGCTGTFAGVFLLLPGSDVLAVLSLSFCFRLRLRTSCGVRVGAPAPLLNLALRRVCVHKHLCILDRCQFFFIFQTFNHLNCQYLMKLIFHYVLIRLPSLLQQSS